MGLAGLGGYELIKMDMNNFQRSKHLEQCCGMVTLVVIINLWPHWSNHT